MKTAVSLRATCDCFYLVGNLIINIETVSHNFADTYVVFTDNLLDENWNAVNKICLYFKKNLKLIEFKKNDFEKNINRSLPDNDFFRKYPYIIFSIFNIFDLLDEFDDVLSLDLDMLIYEDISEIRNLLKKDSGFLFRKARNLSQCIDTTSKYYEINSDFPTPNAGLVYINRNLVYSNLSKYCHQIMSEDLDIIRTTYEESVLGLLLYKFKINFTEINSSYNIGSARPSYSPNIIIHFLHQSKPWHRIEMLECYPEMVRYIEKFHVITDNSYKNINISNSKIFYMVQNVFYKRLWFNFYISIINRKIKDFYVLNYKSRFLQLFMFDFSRNIHYEVSVDSNSFILEDNLYKIFKRNNIKKCKVELHFENDAKLVKVARLIIDSYVTLIKDLYYINEPSKIGLGIEIGSETIIESFIEYYLSTKLLIIKVMGKYNIDDIDLD